MLTKQLRHKSKKITDSARGENCTLRLSVCSGNPETTVWCHLGDSGMGTKSSDVIGCYGCSSCHDEIDRRTRVIKDLNFIAAQEYRALKETLQILLDKGLIN